MPDQIQIFDTTLRDGEQVRGCQLNTQQKIDVAMQLDLLNVDCIEAGFPISSPTDFRSVVEITKVVTRPVICAMARAVPEDIDCAAESVQHAKRKRIHIILSTSDIHIENQLKTTREDVLGRAVAAVKRAKKQVDDIEFCAMDAGRTDRPFLAQIVTAVIDAGATVINIPDTTGYCMPDEYGSIFAYLLEHVESMDACILSAHCHNDLGLATANSLAAIQNGARQVEGTINGVGERAGNAALEEIVMLIKTRLSDQFATQIETKQIAKTSRLVSEMLHMPVQPNKAIVGRNAFAHSSGIHQHGILHKRETYEVIDPEQIGLNKSEIILTARSGRSALAHHLNRLGYQLTKEQIDEIYPRYIEVADAKSEIVDDDLHLLMTKRSRKK